MEASFSREYPPVPFVGVGAIVIQAGQVLLVKRARPPALGEWSLPGGLVHVGETLEAAVVREALEETGLHVVPVGPAELVERIFRDDFGRTRYHYVLADFLCEARGGVLEAGSDAAEVRWAREDELADLGVAEVTVRVIGNAFRCLRGSRGGRRVSLRSLNLKNTCLKT